MSAKASHFANPYMPWVLAFFVIHSKAAATQSCQLAVWHNSTAQGSGILKSPLLLIPADIGWAACSRVLMETPLTIAQIVSLKMIEVLLIATTVVLASLSTKGNSSGSRGVVSQGLKAVLISKSAEDSSATTSTFTTTCSQHR